MSSEVQKYFEVAIEKKKNLLKKSVKNAKRDVAIEMLVSDPDITESEEWKRLDINNTSKCLSIFKSNQYLGLIVALTLFIGIL